MVKRFQGFGFQLGEENDSLRREYTQAYHACISFIDAQIGLLLKSLERNGLQENTIVVLWSDHGWHLGEKNHWHKSTLWAEATRIPFLIAAPGVTKDGTTCLRPVDTLSIYPTLLELCGLKPMPGLDGTSIVPLLKNPSAPWTIPAITEFQRGQCAVRSERYRYIRYHDGTEELYDHAKDPEETKNVAKKFPHKTEAVLKRLRKSGIGKGVSK